MKKLLILLLLTSASVALISTKSFAQTPAAATTTPMALTGIDDASNYYKFASLLHTANLDATLLALGSYTVFAPHNVIFRNMAGPKLDSLTNDPAKLAMVLKAHIVKGKFTKAIIIQKLGLGKGKTVLTNILGQKLTLSRSKDNQLLITDSNGIQAYFLGFDIADPHGVIHGIDNVLVIGK